MAQKAIAGTRLRGGRYYLNLTIPAELRHLYRSADGKERLVLTDTLATADPKIAERRVTVQKARFIEEAEAASRKTDLVALLDALTPEQRAIYDDAGDLESLVRKHQHAMTALALVQAGGPQVGPVADFEGGGDTPPIKVQVLDEPDADTWELEAADHANTIKHVQKHDRKTGKVLQALGKDVASLGGDVVTLPDAGEFFIKTEHYNPQNAASMRYSMRRWREYHGDIALKDLERGHLAEFDEAARGIPVSSDRVIRAMQMRRVIAEAKAKNLPTISDRSRFKMLDHIKAVMRHALDKGKGGMKHDPFAGYRPFKVRQSHSAKREAKVKGFSPEEVRCILEIVEEKCDRQHIDYWLPWLAAYTGARREEIGQLMVQNVTTVRGIPALHITDLEVGQKIKNAHSLRVIPIPPAVIDKGFLGSGLVLLS